MSIYKNLETKANLKDPIQNVSNISEQVTIYTRAYPEYLLAAYAKLKQNYPALEIKSGSDLVRQIVTAFIQDVNEFKSPLESVEILQTLGILTDNKHNSKALSKLNEKTNQLEKQLSEATTWTQKAKIAKQMGDLEAYEFYLSKAEEEFNFMPTPPKEETNQKETILKI